MSADAHGCRIWADLTEACRQVLELSGELRSRCSVEARGWANDKFDILRGGQPMPQPLIPMPQQLWPSHDDDATTRDLKRELREVYQLEFRRLAEIEWKRLEELR